MEANGSIVGSLPEGAWAHASVYASQFSFELPGLRIVLKAVWFCSEQPEDFGGGSAISISVCPHCNLRRCFPVNILPAWRHDSRAKEGKVFNLGEIVMSARRPAAIEVASAQPLGLSWAHLSPVSTSVELQLKHSLDYTQGFYTCWVLPRSSL